MLFRSYTGIVIYNKDDFTSLAKYRIYQRQSDMALVNYRKFLDERAAVQKLVESGQLDTKRAIDPTRFGLSLPSIATGLAANIGQFMSLFRSETTIATSDVAIDEASLQVAIAGSLGRTDPNIKIFMPAAFVPEYDLDSEGNNSVLVRISEVNQGYAAMADWCDRMRKIADAPGGLKEPVLIELYLDGRTVRDQLAGLADAFVSDGFGVVHRKQASVYDVAQRLPHAMGGLVAAEVEVLRRLTVDPERPYVVVLGGSKVSDKLGVIDNLLSKADTLLIGGGMVFTFLKAQGHEVGRSLLEEDQLDVCREYLRRAEESGVTILLPRSEEHTSELQSH